MNQTVATIRKNATEEIRVALTEFSGHDLVDIRVFTEYRESGEIGPTKKGVSFKIQQLGEVIQALQSAEHEARQAGLL